MDRELAVEAGWKTEWLDREYAPLDYYLVSLVYALAITIVGLGLYGHIVFRRSDPQKTRPANRAETFDDMQKKMIRITRAHFVIAIIYLVHAFVITIADAVICVGVLGDDVQSNPDEYTRELWIETALYGASLFAGFMASFFLVPLLQMLATTYLLTLLRSKTPTASLTPYIPDARFVSTHVSQIWCIGAFALTGFWAPADSTTTTFWRYMLLQACIGSALAWLQASFAFNYRYRELERQDIVVGDAGLRSVLCMFGRTARVVHSYSFLEKEGGGSLLPVYVEGEKAERMPLVADGVVIDGGEE